MEAIYGVTMEMLAELQTKDGELRAKFGEQQGRAELEQYLASKGLSINTFAMAHNGWLERFRADPTGRLEAQFHMILSGLAQRAHFGDVRDMSQDVEGGITLDTYAQISSAMAKPGANADEIVAKHGIDIPRWQQANAAWVAAMSKDTTFKLTTQYGTLYQKYAGAEFQQQMFDQTAAMLAHSNAPRDVVDEPEEEVTPDLCLVRMQSPSRNERWRYARLYAHMADLGNVPNKAHAIAEVTPHLIEMLERHDEHTVSDAENAIGKLWDLEVRTDDVRGAVARCLARAKEKLATVKAAFAPIQDKAVPERVTLQSRIQDYTSLVETLEDYMGRDWNEHRAQAPAASYAAPMPIARPMPARPVPSSGGGFPKWVLVPVILAVVGGGLFFARGFLAKQRSASNVPASSASVTSASAAPSDSAAAITVVPATATNTATTRPASSAPPAAKASGPRKKK